MLLIRRTNNMKKIFVSIALIISMLVLSACDDSNITSQGITPVYQEMVLISKEDQTLTSLLPTRLSAILLNDNEDNQGDEGETNVEEPSPELLIEGGSYYAGKNQDIVVNIKISNPDSFEILSFTLNGYKYQSYEFEDGSNSTDLYLTVSTGDVEGLKEYTIDNIKYVDGTEIKDVIIDGDETVEVSVYKDIPIFDNTIEIDYFSISGELVITDVDSAITEDSLVLKLVDGDTVVDETTNLQYTFDSLLTGHEYTFELYGSIDINDVNGEQELLLFIVFSKR